ncbi:1-acyl-sn-glycerol-3-phosphate acyltransferase [Kineosporia sp. J2-2]|uniref:1-acyl-sn-glycerol-3-phosphate acyltransferase n=1 Tax=Kineosporia corallincola TaxID=2835133 RepID=A0ABS5TI84_9ACTN|nr:lysophospholipid acyltransferase family protein [Kineosporia corallincola]MBT0769768.1 1-acyl-sn-glycerol-3-phosphate acyltransferase [Kineosporia corallincola]
MIVLKPILLVLTKTNWRGAENLPATGGVVTVANHVSQLDPFTFAHFVYEAGRLPRFMAKESVFRVPLLGRVVRGARQIPVHRGTGDAGAAYFSAVQAVREGDCVSFFPEGTLTRDPDLWPMRGRTGAVRVALETGAPLIPIAQWGAHEIYPPYGKRLHVFPRHTVTVVAGPPVDLARWAGRPLTAALLAEATEQVMDELTAMLAQIRGEPAPARRHDPRTGGKPQYGNPNPKSDKRKRSEE